ncbi:MAG: response regulator [Deltaproteobacteria bacterium]|nr:response regulator [Deltaproteobacteria bacterium]MBW1930646.1 response regulator [Deltaproteobacteria bacterium]MBW2023941.1 response regulator [Deltaproteobacteria bacterium]MBW2124302.1 response regulator [Deltaproteobacteria bacterium]RLB21593.1 MAG: hybrid sensor histidine kinase/response regulator [Deltaproteobacteria bacterium]
MIFNPKILIVDDEPRMCESLRLLLSGHGYEIFTANSGAEAMDLLSRDEFDLALLDMVIPDMDGHQLMDHISKQSPETLVIVITGHASLDSAVTALRRGAYDYLRKPFEYEELLKTVQNALDQKKLKSEKELINGKLELTEERYRYLVENSPDIIYTLDTDGNFTFISCAVERLLGYKPEDLIGKHYTTIIHDEDLEKAKWFFNERRTGERASSGIELRLKTNTGKEDFRACEIQHLTVELKSTGMYDKPVDHPQKQYLGTHGVARDISDRKRLEAQLHQAQKMEAIGTLAGGIAHDFNNLLMAIQGYTSLMLLNTDSSHPHYEKLKNIEKYVQSGAELTKQLLGFARGGKYDVKPLDLNALIHQTSHMFGRTKKEIIIHEKYDENLWPVEADQGQLEQVLLNLYVNAWQAMPGGGELFLETQNLTLEEMSMRPYNIPPGRYVKITVTDTGVGMDEKTQQRIFEPFFTTKKMGRGTGLGLASVYGIIKNHNGIIEVRSTKGEGTTFEIYLPASDKVIEEEAPTQEELVKGPGTILLVDDEDMIIEVGAEILKALGYHVFSAKSGMEAIKIYEANRNKIDLVILDMIMPGMGGGETYDHLKRIDPNVKVLLSSGYSIDGEASEILERGCNGFIQKPFNIKALSQKLKQILNGKSY